MKKYSTVTGTTTVKWTMSVPADSDFEHMAETAEYIITSKQWDDIDHTIDDIQPVD